MTTYQLVVFIASAPLYDPIASALAEDINNIYTYCLIRDGTALVYDYSVDAAEAQPSPATIMDDIPQRVFDAIEEGGLVEVISGISATLWFHFQRVNGDFQLIERHANE